MDLTRVLLTSGVASCHRPDTSLVILFRILQKSLLNPFEPGQKSSLKDLQWFTFCRRRGLHVISQLVDLLIMNGANVTKLHENK